MDGYKNNAQKINALWEKWYPATSDKPFIGRTNLDMNSVVEMASLGTIPNYIEEIKSKQTERISDVEIVLNNNEESLQAVFWYNTGTFDTSNYQAGLIDNSYRDDLKRDITRFNNDVGRTVVFMTGNLIGKEWGLNHLIKAAIKVCTDTSLEEKEEEGEKSPIRILFFGLKKRIDKIIKDVKFCLNNGAEEVCLMKGEEEFEVLKKLGIDVLGEIKNFFKDDNRVKYISEGTETRINIIKKQKGKPTLYNVIKIKTNNSSKSDNVAVMEKFKENLYETKPDATFICGGNYTASIKNENTFFPSGQLNFMNARKGSNPYFMFNEGNIFKIYPEDTHSLTVVKGGQELYEDSALLINETYKKKKLNEALGNYIKTRIDDKIAKMMSEKVPLVRVKSVKTKTEENTTSKGVDNGKE